MGLAPYGKPSQIEACATSVHVHADGTLPAQPRLLTHHSAGLDMAGREGCGDRAGSSRSNSSIV